MIAPHAELRLHTTRPLQRAARLAVVSLTLVLGGCFEDCSTDVTQAAARGTLRDSSGAEVGSAWVGVRREESPRSRTVTLSVSGILDGFGAPLRGRVRVTRVRAADGGLLYEAGASESLQLPGRDEVVHRLLPLASDGDFQRMREELLAGRVSVELETELPGASRLATVLLPVYDVVPQRSTCVRGSVNNPDF